MLFVGSAFSSAATVQECVERLSAQAGPVPPGAHAILVMPAFTNMCESC